MGINREKSDKEIFNKYMFWILVFLKIIYTIICKIIIKISYPVRLFFLSQFFLNKRWRHQFFGK